MVSYWLIKESLFATILLPCRRFITWAPSSLVETASPLISICGFVFSGVMTETCWSFRQDYSLASEISCRSVIVLVLFSLTSSLPVESAALWDESVDSSSQGSLLELWPSASLLSPAWSDDRFNVHRRTACVYLPFCDFFFYYCKHEDCILHADNSRASLHSSLLGTVWLFGGIMKDFDHFKFINKGRKNWKIEKLCWKAYVLKFFIVPQQ